MNLSELSDEYRESGEKCRVRSAELQKLLRTKEMSETERLILRRRIYIISAMARESIATSNYLRGYYGGRENAGT